MKQYAEEVIHLRSLQIDKYVVIIMNRMGIRVRATPSSLKVFTADQTAIDVYV